MPALKPVSPWSFIVPNTLLEEIQMISGYLHPLYAESLSEHGTPRHMTKCGAWILQRQIPDFNYFDAMGCYPLFGCTDWSHLHDDLDELAADLVSLAVVTDPFGEYDMAYLERCFGDMVFPFKKHFIIDLSHPLENFINQHHRRNARKALDVLMVEKCVYGDDYLDDWVNLYDTLKARHNIKGLVAFSRDSFDKQLKVPGMAAFRAVYKGETVGMLLWYVQGDIGYYHLGAYSLKGYELNASFALFWSVIGHFASVGMRWLSLGAGAGIHDDDGTDGLTRFKKGWSTDTKTAYFCGRIFDPQKYEEILQIKGIRSTNFFPAYRLGEF